VELPHYWGAQRYLVYGNLWFVKLLAAAVADRLEELPGFGVVPLPSLAEPVSSLVEDLPAALPFGSAIQGSVTAEQARSFSARLWVMAGAGRPVARPAA